VEEIVCIRVECFAWGTVERHVAEGDTREHENSVKL